MKIFTSFVKNAFMLAGLLTFAVQANAQEPEILYSEDFENVSLVDADSWGRATSLSNGWTLSSATSYFTANSENSDYALMSKDGAGYNESAHYIEANYGSSNSVSMLVNQKLTGEISFWVRSTLTSSSKNSNKSYVTIYRANEDGTMTNVELLRQEVTRPAQYSNEVATWEQYTVDVKDEYIAINLLRCQFDELVVTAKDVEVVETKALSISAFERTQPEEWTQNVTLGSEIEAEFKVTVENKGNVELAANEVSVSVTDEAKNVLGTATATAALPAGESTEVVVSFKFKANEAKKYVFLAKENIGDTFYTYESGREGECSIDVVDITTTGISSAKAAQQGKAEMFNLNGQRVEKAQKGLYIVNGKKVVLK